MGRISRGFHVLGVSWRVLKLDRELMWLPVISFVCTALVAATFLLPVFGTQPDPDTFEARHYVALGLFYFASTFITVFFNAALVAAAMIRLDGGDPTVADGLKAASSKIGKIAAWSLLTGSVGLILRVIEERVGFLGRIVVAIVGGAWAAISFFVVPVLLFEPKRVGRALDRSGELFRQRWGEQFTGNVSVGLAMFLIAIPLVMFSGLLFAMSPVVGIAVAVLGVGFLCAAGSAVTGIFNAALYRFAATGEVVSGFSQDDLNSAFRLAPGRRKADAGRSNAWNATKDPWSDD